MIYILLIIAGWEILKWGVRKIFDKIVNDD
jgi:hypothetical protein